ncbi:MAG: class I SAM-dependent methyltransferase [Magnetococcales bacterium]|nr:class I SAM-dependent methyltransferase [Magnetococcales bacterium]
MNSVVSRIKSMYWSVCAGMEDPRKSYYTLLKKQNRYFARLAIQGMKWRGFSPEPIHPKHLFNCPGHSYLAPFLKPGIHFLDVGSGSGSDCIKALQEGASVVVGIEYDSEKIALSQARAKKLGLVLTILPLDLEKADYPFADKSFDLINLSDVLEHLNNRKGCLTELARIKKKAAPILISIPNADTRWKKQLRRAGVDSRDDGDHKIEYSQETIQAEIQQAGLQIKSDLTPIIPSFPWNGVIALSAVLSPALYRRLQQWKYAYAKRHPEESIGWSFWVV